MKEGKIVWTYPGQTHTTLIPVLDCCKAVILLENPTRAHLLVAYIGAMKPSVNPATEATIRTTPDLPARVRRVIAICANLIG